MALAQNSHLCKIAVKQNMFLDNKGRVWDTLHTPTAQTFLCPTSLATLTPEMEVSVAPVDLWWLVLVGSGFLLSSSSVRDFSAQLLDCCLLLEHHSCLPRLFAGSRCKLMLVAKAAFHSSFLPGSFMSPLPRVRGS